MYKGWFTKIFGTQFQRELKRIRPIVDAIHRHEARLKGLPDGELQGQTPKLRGLIAERTSTLAAEVERLKREKHDCPDADQRVELSQKLSQAETAYVKALQVALNDVLPETFATVREACRRLLGSEVVVTGHALKWDMVPYDVQLIGGIVLHQGKIAEMATGEGKTLVATLPLYLNALAGRGAHLVTVNNYLARRDSQWMGHLFTWLGLTVGCIDDTEPSTPERRAAYLCDITYGTNNEFGFDYLRDNMVFTLEQRVQRGHAYAIIDEVDSILIDEARTPLIISGAVGSESDEKYAQFNAQVVQLVRKQTAVVNDLIARAEPLLADEKTAYQGAVLLYQAQLGMPKNKKLLKLLQEPGVKSQVQRVELDVLADRKSPAREQKMRHVEEDLYFVLDERGHSVHLTDKGVETMSPEDPNLFVVPDISHAVHEIERDESLSPKEKIERRRQVEADYAMKSETLHIIHKLLQAHALYEREVDYVVQEGKVLIVDEFTGRLMHGRRWSEGLHQAVEAKEGVAVQEESQTLATITIQNYFRMYDKLAGMTGTAATEAEEIYKVYKLEVTVIPTNKPMVRKDDPDLVYKTEQGKWDALVRDVKERNTRGQPVLIGTTSVDKSQRLSDELRRHGLKHEVLNAKNHEREALIIAGAGQQGAITVSTNMAGRGVDILLGEGVKELGGLHVIGTERHEARRIDNQLRGRSGRQGDPGNTRFYNSLEDDLIRIFASDRIAGLMTRLGFDDAAPIESGMVTGAITQAQIKVETRNFDIRKRALELDDVLNNQRNVIYSERRKILEKGDVHETVLGYLHDEAAGIVDAEATSTDAEDWDVEKIAQLLGALLGRADLTKKDFGEITSQDALGDRVAQLVDETYEKREQELGPEISRAVERWVMLRTIDTHWIEHLTAMEELREGIYLRGYGQQDPLVAYKREAHDFFEQMRARIAGGVAQTIMRVSVRTAEQAEQEEQQKNTTSTSGNGKSATGRTDLRTNRDAPGGNGQTTQTGGPQKLGRNDPCWCGSGKKFKKCHGR